MCGECGEPWERVYIINQNTSCIQSICDKLMLRAGEGGENEVPGYPVSGLSARHTSLMEAPACSSRVGGICSMDLSP